MKKTFLLSIQIIILFVFVGCTSSVNNLQKNEPIGVLVQQLGEKDKIVKVNNKDRLAIITKFIESVKWTSDTPKPSVPEENGLIVFRYNTYSEYNNLSEDNPYKVWINEDKSVIVRNFAGKVGTISKEEMSNYDLIYKYLK